MRIFLSWSGVKSRQIAEIFKEWLPQVSGKFEPFVSSSDIPTGSHWATELSNELEKSDCGILCLTRENYMEPWLLYEAGALSKSEQSRVAPFLFDVEQARIPGPLRQLQVREFKRQDIENMVLDFRRSCGGNESEWKERVLGRFGHMYTDLENKLEQLRIPLDIPRQNVSGTSRKERKDALAVAEVQSLFRQAKQNGDNIRKILERQNQQSQDINTLKQKMERQITMLSRNNLRQSVENFRSTLCGLQGFAQESYYKKGMSVWKILCSRDFANAMNELTLFESNLKGCIARYYSQEASLPPEAKPEAKKVADVMFALLISIADIRRELERGLK